MINNNYNTISNSNNKNNKMCCVELKKHPMHMLANFVAFAPTVGIMDYVDTYFTKNISPSLKNEAKENKRNGLLVTMLIIFEIVRKINHLNIIHLWYW